jgi:hypothetical protein
MKQATPANAGASPISADIDVERDNLSHGGTNTVLYNQRSD